MLILHQLCRHKTVMCNPTQAGLCRNLSLMFLFSTSLMFNLPADISGAKMPESPDSPAF